MITSHKHKFVFLAPHKTGTTSICGVILKQYAAKFDPGVVSPVGLGRAKGKHIMHIPLKYNEYFIFASLRNPYHRLISLYLADFRKKRTKDSWAKWLTKNVTFDKKSHKDRFFGKYLLRWSVIKFLNRLIACIIQI